MQVKCCNNVNRIVSFTEEGELNCSKWTERRFNWHSSFENQNVDVRSYAQGTLDAMVNSNDSIYVSFPSLNKENAED